MEGWQSIESAPRDGTEILLFHEHHGPIQGRFAPGEWSEDTPISPAEYSGACWVLGDDLHQEDVEELPEGAPLGLRFHDGNIISWRPLPPPPGTESPSPVDALVEAARRLQQAAAIMGEEYLLDERDDARLCFSPEHHAAVIELHDAHHAVHTALSQFKEV